MIIALNGAASTNAHLVINGRGLSQLDTPRMVGMTNELVRVVARAYAPSATELHLYVLLLSTNGTSTLPLPLQHDAGNLSILLKIKP